MVCCRWVAMAAKPCKAAVGATAGGMEGLAACGVAGKGAARVGQGVAKGGARELAACAEAMAVGGTAVAAAGDGAWVSPCGAAAAAAAAVAAAAAAAAAVVA